MSRDRTLIRTVAPDSKPNAEPTPGPTPEPPPDQVFEIFENEPASLHFLAGIFPTVAARSRSRIDDFDDFSIADLPDLAHLGNEVRNEPYPYP